MSIGPFTNSTKGKSISQPLSYENYSRTRCVLFVHRYFSIFVSSVVIFDCAIWNIWSKTLTCIFIYKCYWIIFNFRLENNHYLLQEKIFRFTRLYCWLQLQELLVVLLAHQLIWLMFECRMMLNCHWTVAESMNNFKIFNLIN